MLKQKNKEVKNKEKFTKKVKNTTDLCRRYTAPNQSYTLRTKRTIQLPSPHSIIA